MCCHGDHWCSPHTVSPPVWGWSRLVMQAGCGRHHFPREEGLFLPVGTKYTKLPNVFMEPHVIAACRGDISALFAISFSLFLQQTHCSFYGFFFSSNWDEVLKKKIPLVVLLSQQWCFISKWRFLTNTHPLVGGGQRSAATVTQRASDQSWQIMFRATAPQLKGFLLCQRQSSEGSHHDIKQRLCQVILRACKNETRTKESH